MVGFAVRVRVGARQIKQFKDAGRRECSSIREPEDAEMRRYGASSTRARVAESAI
jgi:hypothetical protein